MDPSTPHISAGTAGGLAGSVVFGVPMTAMGMMGMSPVVIGETQLMSLVGHMMLGVVLGVLHDRLTEPAPQTVASRA